MTIEKKRKRPDATSQLKLEANVRPIQNSSLLKAEEAFPRGGGSILTPFEYKEATNEAKREALFEESGDQPRKSTKRRKPPVSELGQSAKGGAKVEGLSFKRLQAGAIVLGQVSAITALDLVIALPNNLSGFVSITDINDVLSANLAAAEDSETGDVTDSKNDRSTNLAELFSIGQWVRCAVTSVVHDNQKSLKGAVQKKRIDLSLNPGLVNKGSSAETIQNRCVLQAFVRSIEDHGLIMDLGLDGCSGFVKTKDYEDIMNDRPRIGQTMLCSVTAAEGDRRVLQLSADLRKDPKRLRLKTITTVNAVLPGDGVEVLLTDVNKMSFSGKALGMIDVTCDLFHSNALAGDQNQPFKTGAKFLARIIYVDAESGSRHVGVSLLPHVLGFGNVSTSATSQQRPVDALPIGFTLDKVVVKHVESKVGLFCDVGLENVLGFVHISRISESKVESLSASSGRYKVGSTHVARVVGFSALDGIFLLSMEQNVIDNKYLTVHDLKIGEVLTGTVKQFTKQGISIQISETLTALVTENHIADVKLQIPEKKYKLDSTVKCRVLDIDVARKRITLTLKKSLVNSDGTIFSDLDDINLGDSSVGVIVKLFDKGALIQFYGGLHAFLPSSEMSEAFVNNPREHFKTGQTLTVRVIKKDPEQRRMTVSCKGSSSLDDSKIREFAAIEAGHITSAKVIDKTTDLLIVSLPNDIPATLQVGHLSDHGFATCDKRFQKIRIGSNLKEVVVLDKDEDRKRFIISMKPQLIAAAKEKKLLTRFEDLRTGARLTGFIRKVEDYGVLVGFASDLTGLALKHNLSEQYVSMPSSMFAISQTVSCTVLEVDHEQKRFQLSLKPVGSADLDNNMKYDYADARRLKSGMIVTAHVRAIKETQLNIEIEGAQPGRIDISSIFESLDDIHNKRKPLSAFTIGQEVKVKIIGVHDAKSHKFLALTHRQTHSKIVYECTLKPSDINGDRPMLQYDDMKEGTMYTAFVNNHASDCLWASISPMVRGRISHLELNSTLRKPAEIQHQYAIGSAIQCRMLRYDASNQQLDLSERSLQSDPLRNLDNTRVGTTLPVKVTKVTDSGIMVQVSESAAGKIALTDISSRYTEQPTKSFKKHDILQVMVKAVDLPNKRLALSLRTSSGAVVDPEISSVSDLTIGKQYRGYIKNVADTGLFIELGRTVVARVKIGEVSDAFIKDWKKGLQVDQLVSGTVIAIDQSTGRVEFSLKKNAKVTHPQIGLSSLAVGQVVDATIKKVEEFGVFLQIVSSSGVSGLCHRSEIADGPVKDISTIYSVGDLVKAKILSINMERRRIAFGLKSSYFSSETADEVSDDDDRDDVDAEESSEAEDEADEDDNDNENDEDMASSVSENKDEEMREVEESAGALNTDGFDWTGNSVFEPASAIDVSEDEEQTRPKKKEKKAKKSYDDSAVDFSSKTPDSISDFERLVLGEPDASNVWINYMAFHMQLSDFDAARAVAERALKTINYRRESDKLNIWMALLNLENNFGSEESLETTFQRSCEFNDPQDMYSRLVGTFIRSEKHDKAVETYNQMLKKFSYTQKLWIEYATYLASHSKLEEARDLLPRALKALPKTEHIHTIEQFAILEFKKGDAERGRTLFEGLLSSYPKRLDLWMVLIDQESAQPNPQQTVRLLFDRVMGTKLSMKKAKSIFKKWFAFEKEHGSDADVENVKARATEYVDSH